MKYTKEFVIPGDSVFLEMEEFHRTASKYCGFTRVQERIYPKIVEESGIVEAERTSIQWPQFDHLGAVDGIPTTCTLN